jgi:hypothetical protein
MSLNRYTLFSTEPPRKNKNKALQKLSTYRNDAATFGAMLAACQFRDGDMEFFFAHENQEYPRAVADAGALRSTAKASLLNIVEKHSVTKEPLAPQVRIIDSAALVQ